MEYWDLTFVFTVFSFSLILFILVSFFVRELGKAKKIIQEYKERDSRRGLVLFAYSTFIAELQKQGLSMNERDDNLVSDVYFLRTKEKRPSGIEVFVQAIFFPITVDTNYPHLSITVHFPHEYEKVWGVPALKQEIAEATKSRFQLPSGTIEFHQVINLNLVNVASQIGNAVRFYEHALADVQQEIPHLETKVQEAEDIGDELEIRKSDIRNRVSQIVASLEDDKKLTTIS